MCGPANYFGFAEDPGARKQRGLWWVSEVED